jgi:hypothetical protein
MFGYVKPVVGELLVKEHEFYKAVYCGICRAMKKYTGVMSPLTLTYDSVFLALVRMAYIDDGELKSKMKRCAMHPLKRRCMLVDNSAIEYTARAFAVLSYYKMQDDLSDEAFGKRFVKGVLKPVVGAARKKSHLEELEAIVLDRLSEISRLESENCPSVDTPAELFGELLGEIFSSGLSGGDRTVTYALGFHLGKFIYAADAAEDYDEDVRLNRYNPYALSYGKKPLTRENKSNIKTALLLECKKIEGAVNLIPFKNKMTAEHVVQNIIYLGLVKRIEFLDERETRESERTE